MGSLLSTFGIDWHLLLAQGANFLILAALLTWLLYKPVLKMVKERERVVAQGVEDAERATEKLAAADGEGAKRVREADQTATSIMETARQGAEEAKTLATKEAEARALKIVQDAEARAAEASARALRESEKEIARLALLAAEKVVREKV